MPRHKPLNGLPHNLTQSFFGADRYFKFGYMADWLVTASRQLSIQEATLDIVHQTIDPPVLQLNPLMMHLKDIARLMEKELHSHDLPLDFITEATIRVEFLDPDTHPNAIYCYPTLTDREGRNYAPGRIEVDAFEKDFDPFDPTNQSPDAQSWIHKIKSLFS